ncbi:MAG: class I SAM-dependent methyltransferase [Pseudomonadota bacterium]
MTPSTSTAGSSQQSEPAEASHFWDRMAAGYAAKPVPDESVYARKLELTRGYLRPTSRVLEVGCGTGSTALAHAPYAQHIRATDFSAQMIDIARRKAAEAQVENVEFVQGSVNEALGGTEQYDVILALSVLHLLPDWQDVLRAAEQKLAPGGVLVTSTLCLRDAYGWLRWITPLGQKLGLLPHLSFFSSNALKMTMQASGLRIEHAWQPSKKNGLFVITSKQGI